MLCLIIFSFIGTSTYSNLLPDNKGEYSLFLLWNDDNQEEVPLKGWPEEFNNKLITKIHGSNEDLKAINKKYPELEIEQKPVYIIFDHKNIVLKTNDIQKAIEFINQLESDY